MYFSIGSVSINVEFNLVIATHSMESSISINRYCICRCMHLCVRTTGGLQSGAHTSEAADFVRDLAYYKAADAPLPLRHEAAGLFPIFRLPGHVLRQW